MGFGRPSQKYSLLCLLLVTLLGLGSAQSPEYFEFDLAVPHESVGEPEIQSANIEKGKFTGSEGGGDLQVRLLGTYGEVISKKSFDTSYNMASPVRAKDNASQKEFARNVQEFRVRFEYNSSAEVLEVARNGSSVKRLDVEGVICEGDINASICEEDNMSAGSDQRYSIPIGFILIALTVFVSLLAYRHRSYSREYGGGELYQN